MTSRAPWPRRFYEPDGEAPRVTWALFGEWTPGSAEASLPAGVELLDLTPSDPRFPAFARKEGLGDRLGSDVPDLEEAVREARQARVLIGSVESPQTLDWLRALVEAALSQFEAGGIAMLDANGFRWWAEDELRARLIDEREPRHLVRWIASSEGSAIWLRTAGLATFGRPDVSIRNLVPADRPAAEEVLGRLVSLSVDGARVPPGQEVGWDGRTWRCHPRSDGPDATAFAGNSWLELRRVGE